MRKTTDYELDGLKVSLPLRVAQYRVHYPGQYHSQQAYIELDCNDKTLICSFNGEIGNAMPFAVYHGRCLRWTFPPMTKLPTVRSTMKRIAPLCVKLLETYQEKWNGHNWIGHCDAAIEHEIFSIIYCMGE